MPKLWEIGDGIARQRTPASLLPPSLAFRQLRREIVVEQEAAIVEHRAARDGAVPPKARPDSPSRKLLE